MIIPEIRLLGPLRVRQGKSNLTPGPKAAALLALLAVEQECSRERVLGLLWPESTQKKAQGSLRYLLHSLGKLVPELVVADSDVIKLRSDVVLDLKQLSEADTPGRRAAAAELRHGLFCEGLSSGSAEFDDWLAQQRDHWEQAVVENLLALSAQLPGAEGLKPARQAVVLAPANEKAQANLIQGLMRQGEVAQAHHQLERCREALWEELAVEPSAETIALLELSAAPRGGHNIPHRTQDLIGRHVILEELLDKLLHHRLVTLTGEGGVGKTSLSLEAARHFHPTPEDGVWVVELSRLREAANLESEVARICSVPEGEPLSQALASRRLLLVLDNCEHLLEASAHLVERLLSECPQLKVLATSREALRIAGEYVLGLDPLGAPPQGHSAPQDFPAVVLFMERVKQIGGNLPTELNEVAELCRRLDGLPLAIELAAARTRGLTTQQLCQRLDQRFRLLRGGRRTAETRQKTLHDLIDWSYELLEPEEQELFRTLAVFRSGFHLEAAAAVADLDEWELLDLLERLVEKSLVRTRAAGGGLRYRMLESIQQFAWSKLEQTQEIDRSRTRHLTYFLGRSEELCPLTKGDQQRLWLDQLDSELANFRAALEWALQNDTAGALQLSASLCPLWKDRDHRSEGRKYLELALASGDQEDPQWARALLLRGEIELQQGDREKALNSLEAALEQARKHQLDHLICRGLKGLGSALFFLERLDESLVRYREAREGFEQLGEGHEVANCTNNLGLVELYREQFEEARRLFEEGRQYYLKIGDVRGLGITVGNLAYVDLAGGDFPAALALFRESLRSLDKVGALWNSAYFLEGLGKVLLEMAQPGEAIKAFSVAQRLRDELKTPRLGGEVATYDEALARLREQLAGDFDAAWAEARPLKPRELTP